MNLKVLSMEVTQDLLWVGTNVGAVLIFSTASQSLVTYIRYALTANIIFTLLYSTLTADNNYNLVKTNTHC